MNLDELLSYNPHKKTGTKRERGEKEGTQIPTAKSKKIRLKDGAVRIAGEEQQQVAPEMQLLPEQPGAGVAGVVGQNGVSDAEKLRLLQSLEDEEDSAGAYLIGIYTINCDLCFWNALIKLINYSYV